MRRLIGTRSKRIFGRIKRTVRKPVSGSSKSRKRNRNKTPRFIFNSTATSFWAMRLKTLLFRRPTQRVVSWKISKRPRKPRKNGQKPLKTLLKAPKWTRNCLKGNCRNNTKKYKKRLSPTTQLKVANVKLSRAIVKAVCQAFKNTRKKSNMIWMSLKKNSNKHWNRFLRKLTRQNPLMKTFLKACLIKVPVSPCISHGRRWWCLVTCDLRAACGKPVIEGLYGYMQGEKYLNQRPSKLWNKLIRTSTASLLSYRIVIL